jgi:hypothetical protein
MTMLTKIVAVGMKGDYQPIIHIMEDLYKYCENILSLALTDPSRETLYLFLDIVRMGFVSKEAAVVKWAINLTSKIVYILTMKEFTVEIYNILVKKCSYVPVILMALKRHLDLYDELTGLLTTVARENLEDLFKIELRKYLPAGHGFFKMTHEYLKALIKDPYLTASIEVVSF